MKRIYYYYMALIGFFGLFILLMVWNTILSPSENFPVVIVLLGTVFPLLIPMRGLLNANLKSCTWMSYLSLFYFTYGISEAYISTSATAFYFGILEVFFSLLLCAGCGFFVYIDE
ncbi:MAG: DUF2069 domain-containing protein [Methylococcales symbiont of Hymedesmia sp. n. MRB-2018]|nr:MAG: DUF2069 domain-containing protein [Methylococcales symbiont of Hymedesmia sp. n. MRB-2018]